jgi:hypothetical protein
MGTLVQPEAETAIIKLSFVQRGKLLGYIYTSDSLPALGTFTR